MKKLILRNDIKLNICTADYFLQPINNYILDIFIFFRLVTVEISRQ